MSSKTDREKAKALQEKFQAVLSNSLKDEDNKYCVDCDAKGPRWASWNLGLFLCIRCAGIHRKLGVHVSKVKSVNLDTWTAEQLAMMQEMGNSRARAVYEANLPDNFRRPQTDSALEAFIRAKYELKKYIAKEWVPPQPKIPKEWLEDERDKKKNRPKPTNGQIQLNSAPPPSKPSPPVSAPVPETKAATEVKQTSPPAPVKPAQPATNNSATADLMGLDAATPTGAVSNGGENLLADLFGGPPTVSNGVTNIAVGNPNGQIEGLDQDLFAEGNKSEKSAKDSIMALFGNQTRPQQQMFGVPGGVYVPVQNVGMYGNTMQMPAQQAMPMMGNMQYPAAMVGMQQASQPQMFAMGQMAPQMAGMPANNMMMQGNVMYGNPQQMQFQQMQQQMAAMKMSGPGTGTGGWGNQGSGQTLSTNLWQ